MDNIPNGYDVNGERAGVGIWSEEVCPECGSDNVWIDEEENLLCDSCGHEETSEEVPESELESFNARYFDEDTNQWSEWKTIVK